MSKIAYTSKQIFTGVDMLLDHAIVVNEKENEIESVIPLISVDPWTPVKDFGDALIAPAFFDLQLYGAKGRLFSVFPDTKTLKAIADHCREGGTLHCLPTVATVDYQTIFKCIDAISTYWESGGKGILGLHVEGPWINKTKKGAHTESLIFSPTVAQAKELLEYGKGVIRFITLAPEVCTQEIIDLARSYNVIVSAGHSNATYEQAMHSFENGIVTVTHLYNAMSGLQHRSPGLVGATFDHMSVNASIIPDGYHVDYSAVRIAKKIMKERLFVITDSVTDTSSGQYPHVLAGDKYEANGILSGSALSMNKAVKNLVEHVHIPVEEALRMCSLYPVRLLDIKNGLLKAGFPAEMVVLDGEFEVVHVINN
jgi:N-acetylglucosamine-6-phosphate deacetylase